MASAITVSGNEGGDFRPGSSCVQRPPTTCFSTFDSLISQHLFFERFPLSEDFPVPGQHVSHDKGFYDWHPECVRFWMNINFHGTL